ncbi:uncharacterized protein C15orf39 homolog isoform X2 [Hemicordylus capensis]|uniref:uncharacterized protein C15orf39 homolog isoform X2 n=1 Tax=Hemicordylus capensis TaxID=884348 RepID=UPI0023023984|nr:uncharacterized protein C15orf39 homolog isoform X2 [Hemicordylus capensis]
MRANLVHRGCLEDKQPEQISRRPSETRDREGRMMAEKRCPEPVGSLTYSKLPRLEAHQGHVLTEGLCQSSMLPAGGHYRYKGSYLAYSLQCPEGPEAMAHWSPMEGYVHCAEGAISQAPGTEKAVCMLYRQEPESFGTRLQPSREEKAKDCLARDTHPTQEKWASYLDHPALAPQGWIHGFSVQHPSRAPLGCPTLAAPKPVYRNHVYCTDPGYRPKGSMALAVQTESSSQRPLDAEWALPPLGHPIRGESPSCKTATPPKAHAPESGFLRLQPGPQDTEGAPPGFSPYRKPLEKCHPALGASFLEGTYPAVYNSPKTAPEVRGDSPSKPAWSQLPPPPASPLGNPQTLVYPDRSSACYPFPPYPVTSHEHMLLYHQSCAQAEKQNSVYSLPACKGFLSPGREEAPILPRSYIPPAPRSYYPSHLESYLYRTVGSPPVAPPSSDRDQGFPHNARARVDFVPQNPVSACALAEKAPYCGLLPGRDGLWDWRESGKSTRPVAESVLHAAPQTLAFQPLQPGDRLPGCFGGYGQTRAGLCHLERRSGTEQEPSCTHNKSSAAPEIKKKPVHKAESGACIVISDSPVATQDSSPKGDLPKNIPPGSNSSLQNTGQASEEEAKSVGKPEGSPPPSSPPMPVINNVFSLAPYREYLEGSAGIPFSKACRDEKPGCKRMASKCSPRPASVETSEASRAPLPEGKETAGNVLMEVGQKVPASNCAVIERGGGRDSLGSWESGRLGLLPQNGPVMNRLAPAGGVNSRVGDLAREDRVLDLSLKPEGLVGVPISQKPVGKTEALEKVSPESKVEEGKEAPAQRPEANSSARVLSVTKSNFHSSAAFLFKKFRILKSHTAAGAGSRAPPSCSSPLQPSAQIAVVAHSFSLQQGSEQAAVCQGSVLVQQSSVPVPGGQISVRPAAQPTATWPLPVQQTAQPKQKRLAVTPPEASKALPLSTPAGSPVLGEAGDPPPASCDSLAQQNSPWQYFTALHTAICAAVSSSVSTSSPEQLEAWLKQAEPSEDELREKAVGPAKHRKASEAPKPAKGKEIWLAFQDVALLLNKLLAQLETFLLTRKCPFPHVVRAGTIFIPIHTVKEKLFPSLSGAAVDHVLQGHKVELRPTTLTEEKLLRDLKLKNCTSRMLKLLALKQLPDIYPDLLNLHWHDCVRRQLGDAGLGILNSSGSDSAEVEVKVTQVTRCIQSTSPESSSQDFRGQPKQGPNWESASDSPSVPPTSPTPAKLQGSPSPCTEKNALQKEATSLPQEDTCPVALKAKGHTGSKSQLFQARKRPRTLQVKLSNKVARNTSTSKVLRLQKSVVHIKFQNALQDIQGPPVCTDAGKKRKKLLVKSFRQRRRGGRSSALSPSHPELVGKRIRHLYEEKDKTEAWYRGVVLRVHKRHKNPLKTVYEVKYDSEPEWQYYLEILQDYKRGWLEVDE